jgi:hypothetical protein
MLLYKDDWESARERFNAFWAGEMLDRCCISVTAPSNSPKEFTLELKEPKDLYELWTDIECRYNMEMFVFAHGFYGGEAFPYTWNNLGPGVMASFLGADYTLDESSVWFGRKPIITDLASRPKIELNEQHELWNALVSLTEHFAENAPGKYLMGVTDLGGNLDIAISLLGSQQLILNMIDYPEEMNKFIAEIDDVWFICLERLFNIISQHVEGYSTWMNLWCRDRWYPLQCDSAVLLSPDLFEQFVKPALEREARFLDRAIYHLDGPEQIKHLDIILDVEGIQGIQWQPRPVEDPHAGIHRQDQGNEKWFPLYKKIQESGKNLILLYVPSEDVEKLLNNLSSKGLFISTNCNSEDEARELLKQVEKWSRP